MIRLRIKVDDLLLILTSYDKIKIYRADTETGTYTEITDASTRIDIILEKEIYYYYDTNGTENKWYKTSYYNSIGSAESELSSAVQGSGVGIKVGYSFRNYSPPPGEWGQVLTADDLRFTYLWGIDLQAQDVVASEVDDAQLEYCIEGALAAFEQDFNIDIRKRVYKVAPTGLTRSREWREGVDYTDEEDWYDFDKTMWQNYGFLQLRHYPVLSVETAEIYDVLGNRILDLSTWMRIQKKCGQLMFYPKGSFSLGAGYVGASVFAAWGQMFGRNYPQAFKIEYTTGFESSDFVKNDLRNAIGTFAALIALAWIGDGLLAGFSSSSISLDGLSESFSSTQSATSAYFGARIQDYIKRLDAFRKTNKYKYSNIPIGFIPSGG